MTLPARSAKGLEFPQVFIVGMERACSRARCRWMKAGVWKRNAVTAYVGVTRAMQKLTLTYAETRRLYGKEVYHRPSRFIGVPEECVEEVRLRASISRRSAISGWARRLRKPTPAISWASACVIQVW